MIPRSKPGPSSLPRPYYKTVTRLCQSEGHRLVSIRQSPGLPQLLAQGAVEVEEEADRTVAVVASVAHGAAVGVGLRKASASLTAQPAATFTSFQNPGGMRCSRSQRISIGFSDSCET